MIYGIDPGPQESSYVRIDGERPVEWGTVRNVALLEVSQDWTRNSVVAIEQYTPWSTLSHPVMHTLHWIGRFEQAWFRHFSVKLIQRDVIKRHLLGKNSGNDSKIRQEMIVRYGEPGTKKSPGILYGITGDQWQALAVAVVYIEMQKAKALGRQTIEDIKIGVADGRSNQAYQVQS